MQKDSPAENVYEKHRQANIKENETKLAELMRNHAGIMSAAGGAGGGSRSCADGGQKGGDGATKKRNKTLTTDVVRAQPVRQAKLKNTTNLAVDSQLIQPDQEVYLVEARTECVWTVYTCKVDSITDDGELMLSCTEWPGNTCYGYAQNEVFLTKEAAQVHMDAKKDTEQ